MDHDPSISPLPVLDELTARMETYDDALRSVRRMLADPASLALPPQAAVDSALGEVEDALSGRGPRASHWLQREHPHLTPPPSSWQSVWHDLEPSYEAYVTSVSSRGMAASLETCVYLQLVCRAVGARRVLDLGSGFSSLVLRRYASEAGHDVEVVSVDDDEQWLGRTAQWLTAAGAPSNGLMTWEQFQRLERAPFDVVLHDLAMGAVREVGMPIAARCLAPRGVLLLDDAQALSHRRHMGRTARDAGLTLYSLRRWTLDSIGRWATLAVRPSGQA